MRGFGNVRMKGKLSVRSGCRCCDDIVNGKKLFRDLLQKKEIQEFRKNHEKL